MLAMDQSPTTEAEGRRTEDLSDLPTLPTAYTSKVHVSDGGADTSS